ncbi:Hypothetical protein I595_1387 [Croceitalea dokdonensis DOKDO 023]|uniref:Uncharacterized protein n=1 Tax=Croceitalea dokdonensis DOKDO 023 TaxID=1300341 RepID=A0A0P7A7Y4_9FLAO|nr:Hypothetical protein I595_1387 [Croceitalea dokdonensis DOKDO 023]
MTTTLWDTVKSAALNGMIGYLPATKRNAKCLLIMMRQT